MKKAQLTFRPNKRMALRLDARDRHRGMKLWLLIPGVLAVVATTWAYVSPEPNSETQTIAKTPGTADSVPLVLPGQSNTTGQSSPPKRTPEAKVSHPTPMATKSHRSIGRGQEKLALIKTSLTETDSALEASNWQQTRVRKGESLSLIFSRLGFTANELQNILDSDRLNSKLKKLFPGDLIKYQKSRDGKLVALAYRYDEAHSLLIHQQGQGFRSKSIDHPLEYRARHASATIEDSLYLSAKKSGISDKMIMELANIFGWDIDFALDIRTGDQFTIIYNQMYREGEFIRDDKIIAAEFVNHGKSYRVVRYTDKNGTADYFTPEGKSVRKAFLRTPVNFTRISSRFRRGRWHPVLHHIRAHKGVDYAAKTGTPVKSTSDGKIIYRGRKGGYGRVVIVQHGQRYSTLYAHLSRYKRGQHRGSHVKQGQIIGYVGQSGLATGPHLHYEFRINGVHHNPLTVKLPDAAPLPRAQIAAFKEKTSPLLAQLDILGRESTIIAAR